MMSFWRKQGQKDALQNWNAKPRSFFISWFGLEGRAIYRTYRAAYDAQKELQDEHRRRMQAKHSR